MNKVTIYKTLEEFFPNGTVPYDESLTDSRGIKKGASSPTIDRYPYWPPDLFAAMAVLVERSGAYSYWDPGDSYLLDISREAQWVGEFWQENFLEPDNDYRFHQVRKFLEDDPDNLASFSEAEVANYLLQSQWEVLVSKFGDHTLLAVEEDGDVNEWCYAAIWLMIAADEASKDIASAHYFATEDKDQGPFDLDDEPTWAQAFFEDSLFGETGSQFLSKESASRIWRQGEEIPKGVFETLTLRFDPSVANVLPKMRTPQLGATLRAFSHHVCLLPGTQEVITTWYQSPTAYKNNRVFNILAVPFPFSIPTKAFRPLDSESINLGRWGGFTIDQVWLDDFGPPDKQPEAFIDFVKELLKKAKEDVVGEINAIVFPEASLSPEIFESLVQFLITPECSDVEILIAGVSGHAKRFSSAGPENAFISHADVNLVAMAHFGPPLTQENPSFDEASCPADEQLSLEQADAPSSSEKKPSTGSRVAAVFYQPKHHRWRIDKAQMETYGLSARLGGVRYRWENISTDLRHIQILPIRTHGVLATLVCEDLARVDPCQSLLRSIGPNLVVALLMDGPQLNGRWPGRYATILAEDPGSSVLSLTSAGLVARNNDFSNYGDSHVVGLWRDASNGVKPIELEPNSTGIVLSIEACSTEEWTMDDRSDRSDAISFELVQVTQIKHESVKYTPTQSTINE